MKTAKGVFRMGLAGVVVYIAYQLLFTSIIAVLLYVVVALWYDEVAGALGIAGRTAGGSNEAPLTAVAPNNIQHLEQQLREVMREHLPQPVLDVMGLSVAQEAEATAAIDAPWNSPFATMGALFMLAALIGKVLIPVRLYLTYKTVRWLAGSKAADDTTAGSTSHKAKKE